VNGGENLLVARPESGVCRVLCFSPRHDLTLAGMTPLQIVPVVGAWVSEYRDLGSLPFINHVQIFENKGELMGCSNPHPHGQIWAQSSVPVEPAKETACQREYLGMHGACLLCTYLLRESESGDRHVCENEDFVALVPFWAVWPFELMVLPRRHRRSVMDLTPGEHATLADLLHRVAVRYDNLFSISFPYSMGVHQAPTDGADHPEWHLHLHFYPPLLRSASVRKFMVGYEMLANPQRDITPEESAARLRSLSDVHHSTVRR
jgi:UDPglucose--hexose-1-phosphate uridylyltransferase